MQTTAVYVATNTATGSRYVGVSKSPGRRFKQHCYDARRGSSTHFHRALRKHGSEKFQFQVVAGLPNAALAKLAEQSLIRFSRPEYNMTAGGDGTAGAAHTQESRAKIGAAHKGRRLTAEHREKLCEARRVRKTSNQTRDRIREAMLGRVITPEHRAKISAAKKGCVFTDEHRQKLSAAARNRKGSIT